MESSGGWTAREQARYLRELKPYFITSVLLILAGAAFGVASAIHIPAFSGPFGESLREFAKGFLGLPRPYLALAIFLNNSLKTLAVIVAGVAGGILPLVFLLGNGFALGIVFYASLASRGLLTFFLSITPHGVLELPAILLGSSIGLMLGVRAMKRLFGKGEAALGADFRRGLRFYVAVIVPLLLLAAFIEAFVTASLASK